uniref:GPI inositol-deacylase n=1 Tax=Mus spicilegus TaxID=10103 RepID=A0A8C6MUW9_MUSSI
MFLHSVNLWNLAFYVFMVFLATLGLWDVFFGFEENKCIMSYMFEYPEYQKIELPKKLTKRYPAYELYLYGEGSYAEEHKILPLTGIPVLFLPGNAGSYKQVRSIGSIALRKAEDIDFKYHFDFFSVNFNEELVALYGGSLQKQTKFVHECIKAILKLYKGQEFAPTSVAIIGHSMGGLVARALLTLKNFKQDLINLLVTQATPHVAPVMPLDRFITEFYMNVNNYWILNARHINLTTLSVAGGFRDYQVRSGLTFLPKLSHYTSALSVVSSAVPKTWVSTDHLSIVWCKQLQLTTIRAFFDLIDADTKQITQKPKKKLSVLNHHFIRHPAKQFEENPSIISDLTGTSMWVPVKVSRWSYVAYNVSILSVYFCPNLYSYLSLKSLTLRLQDYPSLSHIVVYVPSVHGSKFVVDCEFFKKEARSMQLPVTHLFSFGLSSRKVTLNTNGLYYNIELLNFGQIYQAFKVNVVSKCTGSKEEITSIYKLHIPWSYEDSLTIAQVPSSTDISLKLHVAQPENDSHVALLKMYTSSDCQYEVTIKTSFPQILGQNPKHSRRSEKKSNHHKDSAVQSLRLCANDAEDSLRMHSTVINLLTWVVLLSMPSLIYWLKNLRYYFKLSPDPCKPLAFLLIPAIAILGNTHTVSVKSSKLLKTVSQFPLPLAVGVIAFGSSHLYRVPCFVIIPLIFHALCNFM